MRPGDATNRTEENTVAAARAGAASAFADLTRRYRPELQVHCYRMLSSLDDSEDLVRHTYLRAWRELDTYRPPTTIRAWLYRMATTSCLDFIDRGKRRVAAAHSAMTPPHAAAVAWLQPCPDRLLDAVASNAEDPGDAVVVRETIELAYVAALQHLPPRQRAVLIIRDVLGWPARETATVLDASLASVNSALQRARPRLRDNLPERRPGRSSGEGERTALERYMAAIERRDEAALAGLLSENARSGRQPGAGGNEGPGPAFAQGRDAIIAAWAPMLRGACAPEIRFMPANANRQPAAAAYVRMPGGSEFRPAALSVLRMEDGSVTDVSTFRPDLFPAFGLPVTV